MNRTRLLGTCAIAIAITGCRGQTSKDEPVVGIRNMYDQEKFDVQEENGFFADKRTMRPTPEGVVERSAELDVAIADGRTDDGSAYVLTIPAQEIERHKGMEKMLARGQERYNIYCAPCHDQSGAGNGMVKQRAQAGGAAAFAPPTFHQDRIRHIPDGQLYATISNGKSNMPPYRASVSIDDRWAIVAYVRALQVSQAPLAREEKKP